MGWEALVDIQAPKDRAWARDKDAVDLLTKCLEASVLLQFCMHHRALLPILFATLRRAVEGPCVRLSLIPAAG
jgi:hypothetical protein